MTQVQFKSAQWIQHSLPNLCQCFTGPLHLHAVEETHSSNQQKLLFERANRVGIEPFIEELLTTYCFCFTQNVSINEPESPKDTGASAREYCKKSFHSELRPHEEVKTVPESRHQAQEVIEESDTARYNPNNNVSESEEVLGMTGGDLSYKTRKDVVYKATFRRMRKYFIQDFLSTTELHSQHRDYLVCLREYCAINFPQYGTSRVCEIFDCIINPKDKLGVFPDQDIPLKATIGRLMHCYSQKLFKRMNNQPEFLEILLHLLGIQGVNNLVFADPRVAFDQSVQAHLLSLRARAAWMQFSSLQ
ncbi:unnamed protein product [Moneuplotes crassus]|uniref:Uncharacterized protein n=1 Tax=Euplotes crassus TaxID=5936 RepID=A0AAD1Y6P9_EUPCR|nr:unnamed protein product [Moneuplotes crassus]